MRPKMFFVYFLCFSLSSIEEYDGDPEELQISYYNMIKLKHIGTNYLLSSAEIPYQSGSNQQIVRGIQKSTLAETFWTIFPPVTDTETLQGQPIECGSTIRLYHAVTGKWLHSHKIPGHFGAGYEVTAFDGNDSGDNWILECSNTFKVGSMFRLQHADTGFYLSCNETSEYPKQEGGEHEIFVSEEDEGNEWQTMGGIFVDDSEE